MGMELICPAGLLAIIAVLLFRGNPRVTFRAKCPCCQKEIIVEPDQQAVRLPHLEDEQ